MVEGAVENILREIVHRAFEEGFHGGAEVVPDGLACSGVVQGIATAGEDFAEHGAGGSGGDGEACGVFARLLMGVPRINATLILISEGGTCA